MKIVNKGKIQLYAKTSFFILIVFTLWNVTLARGGGSSDWHMGSGMMSGWGLGGFGGIFMIFFWVLILVGLILFIRWLIQATGRKEFAGNTDSKSLELLKERYARGDIDKTQFESMKRDLAN